MRIAIASRIFEPEPAAASFRLGALARGLVSAGHRVEVLTVKPPAGLAAREAGGLRVRRFPVLRDRSGYVRGYLQYLSFDLPLFFRILFGPRRDLIVAEPPPTTGFFVRCAARIRRTPYAYYAADIWSDAAAQTGTPAWIVRCVRALERFALRGARCVLSVNPGVTERIGELTPDARVRTVGNGVDTQVFTVDGSRIETDETDEIDEASETTGVAKPYALYSGTASEWQGAGIFIEALARAREQAPDARIVFLGQGSDWDALRRHAAALPDGAVEFVPAVPPHEAAAWMRGAEVALASITPELGYDYAFPTKVQAAWACGTPVIFAGAGTGAVAGHFRDHRGEAEFGERCDYSVDAVAEVLGRAFAGRRNPAERTALAAWATQHVSLEAVARSAVEILEAAVQW